MEKISIFSLILLMTMYIGCNDDEPNINEPIAPFAIENDSTISLDGVINSNTLDAFNEVIRLNPGTKWLIFLEAPGSEDDETNVQVGRKLHDLGLNTAVANEGFIASGAVDLFLAGDQRLLGENAQVGVHSWSDGNNEATDFPRESPEHLLFLNYYEDIGMTRQEAEDFYFFTINAAPADDIHWMTDAELEEFEIERL